MHKSELDAVRFSGARSLKHGAAETYSKAENLAIGFTLGGSMICGLAAGIVSAVLGGPGFGVAGLLTGVMAVSAIGGTVIEVLGKQRCKRTAEANFVEHVTGVLADFAQPSPSEGHVFDE